MADTAVTLNQLAFDVVTADLLTAVASGGTSVTATNTAVVTTNEANAVLFVLYNASGGATVTFEAGDYPPGAKAGLGNLAVTVPTGDCVGIVVDASRFTQSNGTIRAAVATNTVVVSALKLPIGSGS